MTQRLDPDIFVQNKLDWKHSWHTHPLISQEKRQL